LAYAPFEYESVDCDGWEWEEMNKTGILILIAGSVIIAGVVMFFLIARHTMLPAYIIVPCEAATAITAVCFGRKKPN